MVAFLIRVLLIVSFAATMSCIKYDKCDFANVLLQHNISKHQLGDWICLAYHQSNLKTDALHERNWDGSEDYGIFQINSRYWCKGKRTQSNECNIQCSDFLDENLTDDFHCAKRIYSIMGFSGWVEWEKRCKGRNLKEYYEFCDL